MHLRHTWTVLIALACAHGLAAAAPEFDASREPSERPVPRKVLVLGDSLAVSPTASEGFPAELQRKIVKAGLDWTIVNAGVRGDTTTGGLARAPRLLEGVEILVLALGGHVNASHAGRAETLSLYWHFVDAVWVVVFFVVYVGAR